MPQNKKLASQEETPSVAAFVRERVDPLSRAFAETPLMRLRLRTPQGSITLVKTASEVHGANGSQTEASGHRTEPGMPPARSPHLTPTANGAPGRAYTTVNAEVVGIFRDLPEPPQAGSALAIGQLLGHIEALRLRNEVRCPIDGTLVTQVVVNGQPVDFGEALFVVETSAAGAPLVQEVEGAEAAPSNGLPELLEPTEPPRM